MSFQVVNGRMYVCMYVCMQTSQVHHRTLGEQGRVIGVYLVSCCERAIGGSSSQDGTVDEKRILREPGM